MVIEAKKSPQKKEGLREKATLGRPGCWRLVAYCRPTLLDTVTPTCHLHSGCPAPAIFHMDLQTQRAPHRLQAHPHGHALVHVTSICRPCLAPCQPGGALLILCTPAPSSVPAGPHRSRPSSLSPKHRAHGTPVLTTCCVWTWDACGGKQMSHRASEVPKEMYRGDLIFQRRTPSMCPEKGFSHCFQVQKEV